MGSILDVPRRRLVLVGRHADDGSKVLDASTGWLTQSRLDVIVNARNVLL